MGNKKTAEKHGRKTNEHLLMLWLYFKGEIYKSYVGNCGGKQPGDCNRKKTREFKPVESRTCEEIGDRGETPHKAIAEEFKDELHLFMGESNFSMI